MSTIGIDTTTEMHFRILELEQDNRRLRKELENIASASASKWECTRDDFYDEFPHWARSRAQHALETEFQ